MSLFKQLEKFYRPDQILLEDIHTEIVAQVLRNSPDLTLKWLRGIGVTNLEGDAEKLTITTQETFAKLPGHETDSRPDITIRIVTGGRSELVFVESKLSSTQGHKQIERYVDHLAVEKQSKPWSKVSLVYITRDFEAVENPRKQGVAFKTTRWFEFYQYLKAHVKRNSDGLDKELKLFMEENRMSLGNQFRSTDLVALENFLSAKALMDETLNGEVSQKAEKILGHFYSLDYHSFAIKQLRDYHRYIVCSLFDGFECLIGYWLPHGNPDQPVWVGIEFGANPNLTSGRKVIEAFHNWLQESGSSWSAESLNDENWSTIRKGKALHALMGEPDHVKAIKNHLLGLLDEVAAFKNTYPSLPWHTAVKDAPPQEKS